jgi:Protein of unknown function (DUF664)
VNARRFFLDQHATINAVVDQYVLGGLDEDVLRRTPTPSQNSLAWLVWHATRWEDVIINTWIADRVQVLGADCVLGRVNVEEGRDQATSWSAQKWSIHCARWLR